MEVTCHPRLGGACLWQAGVTVIKSTYLFLFNVTNHYWQHYLYI